jgi:glutamyl-tRNA synthetase
VSDYVGRFAPSPTGRIHFGVARTSLCAWLDARRAKGRLLLRIEDIDTQRTIPGAADEIRRDLEWLGLTWDGEVVHQTDRFERYREALNRLDALDRIYPCTCSRKEIASSAPHGPSDDGPRYPGTCRDGARPKEGRAPSVRLRTQPSDAIAHADRLYGAIDQNVFEAVGDFVLQRADGMWAYQLAVTADDLEQGVTCVVRGADLLWSTPRQLLLRRLLEPNARPLETLHVPILLGSEGKRLAKRDGAIAIAEHRHLGPERVIGMLAASLGLVPDGASIRASELIELWDPAKLPTSDQRWVAT